VSNLEIVSIHVPKTGGTSFYSALRDHYGDALVEDNDHVPGAGHDLSEPAIVPDHARAVHGHFRGDRYLDYADAFHITFLRDPAEQLISNYFFWLTYPPSGNWLHDKLLSERPDVLTYAREYSGSLLRGFFGGMDITRLDYVGFADRRVQDCRALSRLLGIHIEPYILENPTVLPPHLQVQRDEVAADPHVMAGIKDALELDYKFYDMFRAHWA